VETSRKKMFGPRNMPSSKKGISRPGLGTGIIIGVV